LAGATVVPVLVVVVGVALPVAVALVVGLVVALALAVALAVPVPVADVDTDAVGVGNVLWWCLQNDALARLSDPPLIDANAPIVMPAATGMATKAAMRARRLR
jgi:hypothetical protein